MNYAKVTRIEVIDDEGRAFSGPTLVFSFTGPAASTAATAPMISTAAASPPEPKTKP